MQGAPSLFCLTAILLGSSSLAWATAPPARSISEPRDFTILKPTFGSTQTGQVEVKVQYFTENETPTVDVQINGRLVAGQRFTKSCEGKTCTLTGKLTVWDGLRTGENALRATLTGRLHSFIREKGMAEHPVVVERTQFDYVQGGLLTSGGANTIVYSDPVSLGLTTVPGGGLGNPWIQVTSGYPASWSADAFPALPGANGIVTVPYSDESLSTGCLGYIFQVVILNRHNPSEVTLQTCGDSVSVVAQAIQAILERPPDSQDLVIFGTNPGQTVPPNFDTSSLGGHNYSGYPASDYPQAYTIIGVPGATPGTAHEVFNLPPTSSHPDTSYVPSLNGTLMEDQNENYNFMPSGDTNFQVHSDTNSGASYITVGNSTYAPPTGINDFWLLVLDRNTLAPINYYLSPDSYQDCSASAPTQSCGAVYTVNNDGGNRLGTELNSLSDQDLIFLVSQGCPVQNTSQMGSYLNDVLNNIGGASYAVNTMSGGSNCNYSLVTANDGSHVHPLTDKVALSAAGAFGTNGQLGSVQGFFARNNKGLYDVRGTAQMLPNSNANALVPQIDYTMDVASSSPRGDWPLVSDAFSIEAYADISYQILSRIPDFETGSRMYDVRHFYVSGQFLDRPELSTIQSNNLGTPGNSAPFPFKESFWDNATPAQFTAMLQQLGSEVNAALSVWGFLGDNNNGMETYLQGTKYNFFSDMIDISSTISSDYSQTQNATANGTLTNVLDLGAGVASAASLIPVVGPLFGAVSAALSIGSAAYSLDPNSIPSPESVFLGTLTQLNADYKILNTNLQDGYVGSLNNILADLNKTQTISVLTNNTGGDWRFPVPFYPATLQSALTAGTSRSLWMDILPQLFGIRQFFGGGSPNPGDYGILSNIDPDGPPEYVCDSFYGSPGPATYSVYTTIGSSNKYDLFLFGEGVNPGTNNDTVASNDLAQFLTTAGTITINDIPQNGLNLPSMLLYAYSNMNHSPFKAPGGFGNANYCWSGNNN